MVAFFRTIRAAAAVFTGGGVQSGWSSIGHRATTTSIDVRVGQVPNARGSAIRDTWHGEIWQPSLRRIDVVRRVFLRLTPPSDRLHSTHLTRGGAAW